MKNKNLKTGLYIIAVLFFVLALRLWQLQVVERDELRALSEGNRLRKEKVLAPRGIIYDRNGKALVKNSSYFSVALLPDMKEGVDIGLISEFLDVPVDELDARIKAANSELDLIKLKEGLSFKETARVEARLSDFPYLTIDVDVSRYYPYGSSMAHLVGYIGRLTASQTALKEFRDVPRKAFAGQYGAEKLFDNTLRGTPGERIIEVDATGRELRVLGYRAPARGGDVTLSIDLTLQRTAEEAFGDKTGALVAIRPVTGEVLALVSRPSFDPNLFSRGISLDKWKKLAGDMSFPMLNRALQSQYPPGSTFKIVTALAALESGAVTPDTKFTCTGVLKLGRYSYGCWKEGGHGVISLHRALVESCDIYFYNAGRRTGIDRIAKYARALGLESKSGLGLVDEKQGLMPDREWKKRTKKKPWYPGDTFIASIGQGFVLVTPFQMARLMAAVANEGRLVSSSILKTDAPAETGESEFRYFTLKAVKDALWGVVNEPHGTARGSKSEITDISGKTGTAQVVSKKKHVKGGALDDHAWFVAYAPSEEPEIALSVIVEHGGHGGSVAAPIAKKAIEAYLKKIKKARKPPRRPVPAKPVREETAPVDSTPEETAPVEQAPVEQSPVEQAPAETAL